MTQQKTQTTAAVHELDASPVSSMKPAEQSASAESVSARAGAPRPKPSPSRAQSPFLSKGRLGASEAPRPAAAVGKSIPVPVAAKAGVAKASAQRHGFKTSEFVVYPAHGVGQITAIEEQEVAGFKLELFVVHFIKDKMTLRVPTSKISSVGMRKLAEANVMKKALDTLTGRARIKRTMWSRRAQEYEAKINSGDLVAIAEVVRDLYRSDAQPEQSYSERQLYEAALDRVVRELSAVQRLTETEALKVIEAQLQRGPRRGLKVETEADGETGAEDGDTEVEGEIEEAA